MLEQAEFAQKPVKFQGTLEQAGKLRRDNQPLEASRMIIALIRNDPSNHAAYAELGLALFTLDLVDRAIGAFGQAIILCPDSERYHVNLSAVLHHAGKFKECIRVGDAALALNSKSALAHMNVGLSHFSLNHWDDGIYHFEQAVRWDPKHFGAWLNLGLGYENLARDAEAKRAFESALKVEPNNHQVKLSLGTSYLKNGDFKLGWEYFSVRFDLDPSLKLGDDVPTWKGEPLEGKTIHLYPEQGLGDLVQFVRFASVLHQQGAEVLATVPTGLRTLLASVPGIKRCLSPGDDSPPCDFQSTVMELPRWLGIDSTNMALSQGYLTAPKLSPDMKAKLEIGEPELKVGLVWAGNPNHVNDARRSMSFEDIEPLLDIPNLKLVNLQMGSRAVQLWEHPKSDRVLKGVEDGMTALETASLVQELDIVITVDTFIAHMSGALGVPTWILLARNPDWRWLGKGDKSAWYDSARLFRQDSNSHWGSVIEDVVKALHDEYPCLQKS